MKFLILLHSVNLVKKQTLLLLSKLSNRQTISYLLNCTVIIYQFIFPLAIRTLSASCSQFAKVWQRITNSCFQLNQKSLQCKKQQRSQGQLQVAERNCVQCYVFWTFVLAFILPFFFGLRSRSASICAAVLIYPRRFPQQQRIKNFYRLLKLLNKQKQGSRNIHKMDSNTEEQPKTTSKQSKSLPRA